MINHPNLPALLTVAALTTALLPTAGAAQHGGATYRGYRLDLSKIEGQENFGPIAGAMKQQIDIIENVGLKPQVLEAFRKIPIVVSQNACPKHPTRACYNGQIVMAHPLAFSPENPVLLHEMMHVYHHLLLPQGERNPDILTFYNRANRNQFYPSGEYLLSNQNEFFAMTASVFLYGRAAREPYTRANLKAKQPRYFEYLERLFAVHPGDSPSAVAANAPSSASPNPPPLNAGARSGRARPQNGDCLQKTYLGDGRVRFLDRCTGEESVSEAGPVPWGGRIISGAPDSPRFAPATAPESAAPPLLAMAMSWNASGGWAVQKDDSFDIAASVALARCNSQFGSCTLSDATIATSAPGCLAIARAKDDSTKLFAGLGGTPDAARAEVVQQLSERGLTAQIEYLDCNSKDAPH
jgi:hypothetical protein